MKGCETMLIVWIRKNNYTRPEETAEERTYRHNKDMARFKANPRDWDVADARAIVTADCNLLAAMQGVKLPAFSRN